jgi:serine/threonine-protein kinase HipA
VVEKIKLFRLTLVNFLIGNEDMHLKNFSLITREGKIELSPAYDILNSTIVLTSPQEETALPMAGKRRKLSGKILIDYFGQERLGLNRHVADSVLEDINNAIRNWRDLLNVCFLSDDLKEKYSDLLNARIRLMF